MIESSVQFLEMPEGYKLAYRQFIAEGAPKMETYAKGVIFLGGFYSDMEGTKAVFLEQLCRELNISFIRFDYFGHGQSDGEFTDGSIGRWSEDGGAMLERLTQGPQVLVGSSMGGWIMLNVALKHPERIAGLVGIAAAPDFTETLIWDAFNDEQKKMLIEEGSYTLPPEECDDPEANSDPYPIMKLLIEEGRSHLLMGKGSIPIRCPVTLLHGIHDRDVPPETSLALLQKLESEQVQLHYLKNAGHRMSSEAALKLLKQSVKNLLETVEATKI